MNMILFYANTRACECICYLNSSIWKRSGQFEVTLNWFFPKGLLFSWTLWFYYWSHIYVWNTEALWSREDVPLWCCYSTSCTCRIGSLSCKLFLEPNKDLGVLVCLVSKIVWHGVKCYFFKELNFQGLSMERKGYFSKTNDHKGKARVNLDSVYIK